MRTPLYSFAVAILTTIANESCQKVHRNHAQPQKNSAKIAHVETTTTREDLGRALGRVASGVYVVTAENDGEAHGMLTTWLNQAAFEPPMVTVAVNTERPIVAYLKGATITVNVLSSKNMDIFKAFARPSKDKHDDRFEGLATIENEGGAIAFANVVAILNCKVRELYPAGDHFIAIAEVISGRTINSDAEPMIHLRKNGFQY